MVQHGDKTLVSDQLFLRCFFATLLAMLLVHLIALPIHFTDTDMWYHLAGGRHLFDTGHLGNPFHHSFIEPPREFINYFWGFQAFIYSIWLGAGYFGLVILKTILLFSMVLLAFRILYPVRSIAFTNWHLIVLVLVVFLFSFRGFALRPHLFSFLFISAFITILQYRRQLIALLPILALAWINTHGVEWVVGALLCGSFILATLVRSPSPDQQTRRQLYFVLACLPVLLINPNGALVLLAPFNSSPEIYQFILELRQLDLVSVLNPAHSDLSLYLVVALLTVELICLCLFAAALSRTSVRASDCGWRVRTAVTGVKIYLRVDFVVTAAHVSGITAI